MEVQRVVHNRHRNKVRKGGRKGIIIVKRDEREGGEQRGIGCVRGGGSRNIVTFTAQFSSLPLSMLKRERPTVQKRKDREGNVIGTFVVSLFVLLFFFLLVGWAETVSREGASRLGGNASPRGHQGNRREKVSGQDIFALPLSFLSLLWRRRGNSGEIPPCNIQMGWVGAPFASTRASAKVSRLFNVKVTPTEAL